MGNCLFGAVKLTKNADLDKYQCSGYGIGFDARSQFLLPGSNKNIIFGVDMNSYVHVDNIKKDILFLVEGPTQELDDTAITAEVNILLILQNQGKDLC